MFKVKDFVFALLTLICVSPAVGEKQVFPKAKEWPKFEGLEWGMSEDEFYEACAKKKLERVNLQEDIDYPKNFPDALKRFAASGILLGQKVNIIPYFEKREGKWEGNLRKGVDLNELNFQFTVTSESRRDFEKKLSKMLTDKYGPSKYNKVAKGYSWGAPHKPHRAYITWGRWLESKLFRDEKGEYRTEKGTKWIVYLEYKSKSRVDFLDALWKKEAAKKRELEKKAKEDEKDF